MAVSPKTHLKVVFGSMTFGTPGKIQSQKTEQNRQVDRSPGTLGARVSDLDQAAAILDVFQQHGHNEIDSARVYGNGSSEAILGDLKWQNRGMIVDTKLYPNAGTAMASSPGTHTYTLTPADVRRGLEDSLKALQTEKIDMFYLHGPDRKHPFEDTLREVNELYKEGKFKRFGLSNFMSWEVARICEICETNRWIKPTVYQGIYNALHRKIEDELVPCLRFYNITLYAFQPLAGGFLTSRYHRKMEEGEFESGSRFDPKGFQGKLHQGRYWNEEYFDALEGLREAAGKFGISEAECAQRWLEHHSQMSRENGDAIIVGASSARQLEESLNALEKGPLPDEIVEAMEKGWSKVKGLVPKYWH